MNQTMISFVRLGVIRCVLLMGALGALGSESLQAQQELGLISAYAGKLDPFESHQIKQADEAFAQKKYGAARAAYDSFLLEFPQSIAVAYAVYRKGRSLHLENKRFEAIKVYQEVIDYFPSDVYYATAALYYIGDANWENGDKPKALAAWNQLIDDADYRKQGLAAFALNRLASVSGGEQAIKYFSLVAKEFRRSNPQASKEAMNRIIDHYVSSRKEPELRAFYTEMSGFQDAPVELKGEVADDRNYWVFLKEKVKARGQFSETQLAQRKAYFQYWATQMAGINPEWQDLLTERIQFQLDADGDWAKRNKELDQLFASKPVSDGRVLYWLKLYPNQKDKQTEYFSKLNGKELKPPQAVDLLITILRDLKNPEMAKSAVGKLPLSTYSDQEKESIAMNNEIWQRNPEISRDILMTMKDPNYGKWKLLSIYDAVTQSTKALELTDDLVAVPSVASGTYFYKGRALYRLGKHEEAIAALRQSQQQPDSNFLIAEAMVRLGQVDQAVGQLREIENFFKPQASEAAWRAAIVYRDAGRRDDYVAALRGIMKKYPGSAQSSSAHQELEKMGIRIGGGVDAKS